CGRSRASNYGRHACTDDDSLLSHDGSDSASCDADRRLLGAREPGRLRTRYQRTLDGSSGSSRHLDRHCRSTQYDWRLEMRADESTHFTIRQVSAASSTIKAYNEDTFGHTSRSAWMIDGATGSATSIPE